MVSVSYRAFLQRTKHVMERACKKKQPAQPARQCISSNSSNNICNACLRGLSRTVPFFSLTDGRTRSSGASPLSLFASRSAKGTVSWAGVDHWVSILCCAVRMSHGRGRLIKYCLYNQIPCHQITSDRWLHPLLRLPEARPSTVSLE